MAEVIDLTLDESQPDSSPPTFHFKLPLKSYQRAGVKFIVDAIVQKKGLILADEMGLGKTVQIIASLSILLSSRPDLFKTCLILAPASVLGNWAIEFNKWLPTVMMEKLRPIVFACRSSSASAISSDAEMYVPPFHSCRMADPTSSALNRVNMLKMWMQNGGILLTNYELFRTMLASATKSKSSDVKQCFLDPGPDIIVLDEGHRIKSDTTAIHSYLKQVGSFFLFL